MAAIDEPVELAAQLHRCLARLTELSGGEAPDWDSLVRRAATVAGWPAARADALRAREPAALEELAVELNELRTLAGPAPA